MLLIIAVRMCTILSSLAVIIYLSHKLPSDLYGGYQSWLIQLSVLIGVAGLGIAVFVYSYSKEKLSYIARKIPGKVYFLYFFFLLVVAASFALLQYYTNDLIQKNKELLVFSVIYFVGFALSILFEAILTVFKRYILLLVTGLVYGLVFVLLHLSSVKAEGFDFSGLLILLSIFISVKVIILGFYVRHELFHKRYLLTDENFNMKTVRSLWAHLCFFDVGQSVFRWVDKFILIFILSSEVAALYVNSTFEIPILPFIYAAIQSASFLQINSYPHNDHQIRKLIKGASIAVASYVFPVLFFLIYFREEFITVVFSEKYIAGIPIFLCAILKIPLTVFNTTFFIQYKEKGSVINKGAVMDMIISIMVMYPLYLLLGLKGVALSIVLSTFIQVFYYSRYSARMLHVSIWELMPWLNWLSKVMLYAVTGYLIYLLLSNVIESDILKLLFGIIPMLILALLVFRMDYKKGYFTFISNK